MLDYVLIILAGVAMLAQGAMGFIVTTRPPDSKTKKHVYEGAFAMFAILGFVAVVWGGIRAADSSSQMQTSINSLQTTVGAALAPDPHALYQGGAIVGRFGEFSFDANDPTTLVFTGMTADRRIDFTKPLEARGFKLLCRANTSGGVVSGDSDVGSFVYGPVVCAVQSN